MKSDETIIILDYRIEDPERRYLVYSKTIQDKLPLTTTSFDTHPCVNPKETSSQAGFYPSELDRGEVCILAGGYKLDPRYSLVGESKSEFDL